MSGCHVPSETIEERLEKLEEHKNRQVDENRKISRRCDEAEQKIRELYCLNSKRVMDDTLISRRLTEIERFQNNDNGNNKYCFECGRKHED